MAETTEPYEVEVTGETYRVVPEDNAGVRRICVHSGGQFRFSLPGDTPDKRVRTFIQVYGGPCRTTSKGGSISRHGGSAKPLVS
jgi:hypothetical protein